MIAAGELAENISVLSPIIAVTYHVPLYLHFCPASVILSSCRTPGAFLDAVFSGKEASSQFQINISHLNE